MKILAATASISVVALLYHLAEPGYPPALAKVLDTALGLSVGEDEPPSPLARTVTLDLKSTPKIGDPIGPYVVTSTYGPRKSPCAGCSSDHKGLDIGAPHGSKQFVPDFPDVTVKVTCDTYWFNGKEEKEAIMTTSYGIKVRSIHLSACYPGSHKGGDVFALTGTSGTGPHQHIEVYGENGIFSPPTSIAIWISTGTPPS